MTEPPPAEGTVTIASQSIELLLTGKPDDLKVAGWAELQKARLVPHAIDTPIDVSSGRLALQRDKALLQRLRATVDGATTEVNG